MKNHLAGVCIVSFSWRPAAAGLVLAALFAGSVTVLATMAHSQTGDHLVSGGALVGPGGARPPIANSLPADPGDPGPFAFGYVEFDWDPRSPGSVPGFDSWPPASPRR